MTLLFIEYLKKAFEYGHQIKTSKGIYLKWELGNGVELWGQLDKSNNPIGMNPHFRGLSKISVRIESIVERDNNTILDGAFQGWACTIGEEDSYPFVIDTPNMAMYDNIVMPQIMNFQIAAFAHEVKAYANDQEFSAAQDSEMKFAAESFIPSGLFNPNGESTQPPEALAIFNGHIIDTKEIVNSITSNKFYWALVDTLGGQYDVVIDPSICEGELKIGGVLGGSFWLSGVIVDVLKQEEKSLLKRLFKR